jgi:MFS family permease
MPRARHAAPAASRGTWLTAPRAGGRARAKVAVLLAAVLGLNGADQATISATANNLERAFGIGNTQLGLLVTVVALAGAAFTLPVGVLTDRTRRTRLLALSVAAWAAAALFSGMAVSYSWLLIARIALGAVSAAAGPTVASLTGDFFPAADRGRIYGLILGGDLVGSAIGFVLSGDISSALSWRFAFWWLVPPSLALAWLVWRLPEPARGGLSQLPAGAEDLTDPHRPRPPASRPGPTPGAQHPDAAARAAAKARVEPQAELVLHADPARRSVWWAIRYVLRVRTNVIVIVASALGYFFFTGLRSFSILYVSGHYGLSKPVAGTMLLAVGAGALAGVFVGGRVSDRLLRRGHIRARIIVPVVCLIALVPVLAPALATTSVAMALPLFMLGAFLLGAPNPAMDAARLDIIPAQLWGRAEGVRTVLRTLGEAGAPLVFGYVSQYVFGGPGASSSNGSTAGQAGSAGAATGLEYTFLVFLIPLLGAGLLALLALRSYPRDVATAAASQRAISEVADREADRGIAQDPAA